MIDPRELTDVFLLSNIVRDTNGVVCFNRDVVSSDSYRTAKMYFTMNKYFMMTWEDIDNLTIFFCAHGRIIYGGLYNCKTKVILTKRPFISETEGTPYTYTTDEMDEVLNKLKST